MTSERLTQIRQEWLINKCCETFVDGGYDHRCITCGCSETTHDVKEIFDALAAAEREKDTEACEHYEEQLHRIAKAIEFTDDGNEQWAADVAQAVEAAQARADRLTLELSTEKEATQQTEGLANLRMLLQTAYSNNSAAYSDRDAAQARADRLETESNGRLKTLLEKAEEARREWQRAENAEGKADRLEQQLAETKGLLELSGDAHMEVRAICDTVGCKAIFVDDAVQCVVDKLKQAEQQCDEYLHSGVAKEIRQQAEAQLATLKDKLKALPLITMVSAKTNDEPQRIYVYIPKAELDALLAEPEAQIDKGLIRSEDNPVNQLASLKDKLKFLKRSRAWLLGARCDVIEADDLDALLEPIPVIGETEP